MQPKCEPYEQSLPGDAGSIPSSRAWIQAIARKHHPNLAKDAGEVIGELMAIAIRRTPDDGTIYLKATPSDEGLAVEIRDPGQRSEADSAEWKALSTLAWSARCSGNEAGHLTEVEIRAKQAATA